MKIFNNNTHSYNEIRSVLLFGENNKIQYKKDVFDLLNKLRHKFTGIGYSQFLKGFFYSLFDQSTPCHFFNTVCLSKNDWIVTFETTLPRIGNVNRLWFDMGVERLTRTNCKRIIALSKCAYDLQIKYLKEKYPLAVEIIQEKMIVMHPPQHLLVNSYADKKLPENKIVFTIVGSDFFRKGGLEVLEVFNLLIPLHPKLKLNIISSMLYGDYASQTTINDYKSAMALIEKFPENIEFHNSLPNEDVLRILINSHVGLLPTWGDTYGYSVLEAQAAGCPVISTDLRALPEINNDEIGWVIKVPLNEHFNADIDTPEKKSNYKNLLVRELKKIILEILQSPDSIQKKGHKSIEKIKRQNSIEVYMDSLQRIYQESFKS